MFTKKSPQIKKYPQIKKSPNEIQNDYEYCEMWRLFWLNNEQPKKKSPHQLTKFAFKMYLAQKT